jgi:hypothetical protein
MLLYLTLLISSSKEQSVYGYPGRLSGRFNGNQRANVTVPTEFAEEEKT